MRIQYGDKQVKWMKTVTVSNALLSPMALPGMGRSVDLAGLTTVEVIDIRDAFAKGELFVEFTEEPGVTKQVINLWANPHSPQVTLFIK